MIDAASALSNRIVLGTVQLGVAYGRRRGHGVLTKDDARRILDAAWEIGIRTFDTAEAYGASADRLAEWLRARKTLDAAHVVTKVQLDNDGKDVRNRAAAAIGPFRGAASLTLLSHGPVNGDVWDSLLTTVEGSNVALGQSVYTAEEVKRATQAPRLSRIQAPANVFDRRALIARGQAKAGLDLRSIYLQGVLLDQPDDAEGRAPGAGRLARVVAEAAFAARRDAACLLLAAALGELRTGDRVVIGVDSSDQFLAIEQAFELPDDTVHEFRSAIAQVVAPDTIDPRTLDPRTWQRAAT